MMAGFQAPMPTAVLHPSVRDLISRYVLVHRMGPAPSLSLKDIIVEVANEFGVTVDDIRGDRRSQYVVSPRHAYFWLARHLTTRSFPVIARAVGRSDHTTAIYAVDSCVRRMADDPDYRFSVMAVRTRLEARA